MQFEIKETEYCRLNVDCKIEKDLINKKKLDIIEQFRKSKMKVPGFRDGQATDLAISLKYAKEIDMNLKNALLDEMYNQFITEQAIKPYGRPVFLSTKLENNEFNCNFMVHRVPTFELKQYKGFEIPKPEQKVTKDEHAQKLLQELRERFGDSISFTDTDFVQDGDSVIIDYTSTLEGKKIDQVSAEGELITIGKSPLPDFNTNLLGMKLNEEREFDVKAPEDAQLAEIAGKTIHMKVSVKMGTKTIPAKLDDELAKKLEFKTLEELTTHIYMISSGRVDDIERKAKIEQVAKRLLENHDFEIPSWLYINDAKISADKTGVKWDEMTEKVRNEYIRSAHDNSKLAIILDKIRTEEPEAQLGDTEIIDMIKEDIKKYPNVSFEEFIDKLQKSGQIGMLVAQMKDNHTLKFLLENSTIIE